MSKIEKFLFIFTVPVVVAFYGFLVYEFGWLPVIKILGGFAVMMTIVLAVMAGIVAVVNWATIFKSKRYAECLRDAGYEVYIHKNEIMAFATMCLMALMFVPMSAWLTYRVWSIHICIQAGQCYESDGWYHSAPVMAVLFCLIGLISLGTVVYMWWNSFRPLRKYYNEMQLGHPLDLPRLR